MGCHPLFLLLLGCTFALHFETSITISSTPLQGIPPITNPALGFSGGTGCLDIFSWRPNATAAFEPRPSYRNLMSLLGSPAHRILHWWASLPGTGGREPAGVDSTSLNVSASCARMAAALAGWGGTLTAAIKFSPYTDTGAAGAVLVATAAELRACLGAQLTSVEMANEPDIAAFSGNITGYIASVAAWGASLSAAGLTALWDVGVLAGSSWYSNVSAIVNAAGPAFKRFSIHTYPLSACPGDDLPTVPALLAVQSPANAVVNLRARAAPAPVLVGEASTAACGGFDGVSNVFAAALYGLDATVASAAAGISPYIWHGISSNESSVFYQPLRYAVADIATPGADTFSVAPLFYGLWAAADTLTPNASFLNISVTGGNITPPSPLFRTWALADAQGATLRVLLLNKAGGDSVLARVRPCSEGALATVKRLIAPSLLAQAGVEWGNQTLDGAADGVPRGGGAPLETAPCVGGAFAVLVPNASAALLQAPMFSPSPTASPTPSATRSPSPSLTASASPAVAGISGTPTPTATAAAPPPQLLRNGTSAGAAGGKGLAPAAIGAAAAAGLAAALLLALGVAALLARRQEAARGRVVAAAAAAPHQGRFSVRSRLASHRENYIQAGGGKVRNPLRSPGAVS
jgi:hypothetical protein